MANISISLQGIDQAIANLKYRPSSIKYKAIMAIRAFYTSEESISTLEAIDTDELVKVIWDVGDQPSKIKSKRRNFSSVKSSINSDLEKLSKKELNPENITILDTNTFDMTQEAKNNLLSSFSDAVTSGDIDLDQATNLLKVITEFLDTVELDETNAASVDLADQIKNILNKISREGLFDEEIDGADGDSEEVELDEDEELEEIEVLDEDYEIEEIEEIDEDEALEEIEELDEDSDETVLEDDEELEEVELDEDEDLEEIDELDDDFDIEEIELDEDDEIEEIEDLDDDIEEIELDEDEIKALEEFRNKKELAEHFDDILGEREKKFNKYSKVPEGPYTIGTKKSLKSSLELQQFHMPKVYIGIYPVTNSLFEVFVERTGYITTAEKLGYGRVYYSRFKKHANGSVWNKNAGSEDVQGACWYKPSGPDSTLHEKRNHPVVQVSVDDAIAFSSWIGRRIPTEAEWEAAARTDFGYKYPWGNEFNPKAMNIEQSGLSDTSSVDAFDSFANEFNIIDMLGNVMEWTSDMETPPIKSKKSDAYCIAKGAGWNAKDDVTISSRALFKPGFTSNIIGFRCISEIFQ